MGDIVSSVVGGLAGGLPVIGTALGLGSSLIGADASRHAANVQADAATNAAQLQKQQFDKQVELQAPFREAGLTAQNRLLDLLGLSQNQTAPGYGSLMQDFGQSQFQTDPGYQFRLSEGLKALDRQAAARGGLISGAALKAAERYGQGVASDEYQNAFNRYQVNRANKLNPLQAFLGQGQSATNALGAAGQNYANQAGEAYQNAANARASGYVGGANALTGGISNLTNYYQNQQALNMLRPGGYSSQPIPYGSQSYTDMLPLPTVG